MNDSNTKKVTESNTWIELSKSAVLKNISIFKKFASSKQEIMSVVKANGYGHGMVQIATLAIEAGADRLGVFTVSEGELLRTAGLTCPVLVLGPATKEQMTVARQAGLTLTLGSVDAVKNYVSNPLNKASIHLKVETGTNRQGISFFEIEQVAQTLHKHSIEIEGIYTHFADIEDTTDHTFALKQLDLFNQFLEKIHTLGHSVPLPHTACTAAAILFPDTYFAMLRIGIGTYGLWPSRETNVSAHAANRDHLGLVPVMTWKTKVAQIKTVKTGEFVGYGRTFRATRNTRIAILPVGYADGYSRSFSNTANTLVHGKRARVAGRVCMNLTMIDITDIPDTAVGDEVTLLGTSGDETISAEYLASIAGTINYEIVTRIAPPAPRIVVT